MLRFLRAADPVRRVNAHNNPACFEDGATSVEFHGPDAEFGITQTVSSNKSIFQPPLHLHVSQVEDFYVVKGEVVFSMPRNADPAMRQVHVSSSNPDPKARRMHVPAGEYHRFVNARDDVPLVMQVRHDPLDCEMEESFFRNFFGYLDDCRVTGTKPSVFQLMLLLHVVDSPLALPIPGPRFLGVAISWAFTSFMGVFVGKFLLGYKASYVEYYNPKKRV